MNTHAKPAELNLTACVSMQLLILLSVLESFTFCPSALIKAFAEKVIAEPAALALKDILCILKVYSSVGCDLEQRRPP